MKDEKVEKLKAQIDKWSAEIDGMEADLKGVRVEARLKYQESLDALKARRDRALQKYEELKEASEDSFDHIRQGMIAAWHDLADGIKSAKNAFRGMM